MTADEGIWFVVTERSGRQSPSIYFDHLPDKFTGKRARDHYGVVHLRRLDTLPDAERWLNMTLAEIWNEYKRHTIREIPQTKSVGVTDG